MEGASAGSVGAATGQDREERIAALRESIERHTVPSHPLAALKPHPRNSRVHPPAQLDQIERSMLEWGWTMPILADEDGTILAGHGRKMVASRLGLDEAPVIFATGWSDDQKRAYIIADNKLPENAEWDPAMLKLELEELNSGAFDLSLSVSTRQSLPASCSQPKVKAIRRPFPMRRSSRSQCAVTCGSLAVAG